MNTWYDSLVNYIPEPIRKIVGGFEDKVVDLYNTNTLKQTVYETGKKLSKPKTLKQSDLKKIFSYKKKKKKEIKDTRALFEEDCYKPKRVSNFWNNNYIHYESNGDRNRNFSLNEYLDKIRPYLRDKIIDLQESDTRKIQLAITINFISSKDTEEESVMHSKSNNIKFTSYHDANKVVDEVFDSLRSIFPGNLEKSMEGSEFIFDSAQLMYCKCHKVKFRRGGSHINSPDSIKTQKATINPKHNDDKYFQYVITVALSYGEIESHPERVSNI